MSGQRRFPAEVRERAVRLVLEHRGEYESEYAAIRSIAGGATNLNAMSMQVDLISTAVLVDLLADGIQMIGGELVAFSDNGAEPFLIIRSARGDEWDVEADDPAVLTAVREAFADVVDLPA